LPLVILIGDCDVGKTSLLSRYLRNLLPKTAGPTIGVEFATKNATMKDGATVKAQLWDTAGTEKYRAITVAHYRKALGALVVYDITKRQSFEHVQFWLESLLS
jgi:small GTP-binding protein